MNVPWTFEKNVDPAIFGWSFIVNVKLIHSVVQVFYIFNNFFGLLFNVN